MPPKRCCSQHSNRASRARIGRQMSCSPTVQWLLANARSLTVKNLTPSAADNGLVLEIYSTNTKGDLKKVLWSTVHNRGCFPSWAFCGLSATPSFVGCRNSTVLVIRLLSMDGFVAVEENFDLARLLPIPSTTSVPAYPPNFVCLDIRGIVYSSDRQIQGLPSMASISPRYFTVDEDDLENVEELHTGQALRAAVASSQQQRRSDEHISARRAKLRALEEAKAALAAEQALLQSQKRALHCDSQALQTILRDIDKRTVQHKALSQANSVCRDDVTEKRRLLSKLKFLLEARQMKLLADLQQVYPIERADSGSYYIRGVELPIDASAAKDDEAVASALGYAVHLVLLAAKYLEVSLRFQLLFMGSRSLIRDPALVGLDNTFPLFKKSIEKDRFERAMMWFRANVEQLLSTRGLVYEPAKPLLHNLRAIFDCEQCFDLAI